MGRGTWKGKSAGEGIGKRSDHGEKGKGGEKLGFGRASINPRNWGVMRGSEKREN